MAYGVYPIVLGGFVDKNEDIEKFWREIWTM
jgi:hypothetical protein